MRRMAEARRGQADTGTPPPVREAVVEQTAVAASPRTVGKAVTLRSVLVCLLLLPVNAYWVVQMEIVRYSAHPTTISLFFNTIFILLCLTLLNRGVRRFAPRAALNRGELLLVYAVLSVGSCVAG